MSWRKGKGEEKNDENGKNVRDRGVCPQERGGWGTVNHDWNIPSFCPLKTMRGLVLLGDMSFWK